MLKNEIQCQQYNLLIDEYLEHQLQGQQLESFEAHIQACNDCQQELAVAYKLMDGMSQLPFLDCADETVDKAIAYAQGQLAANVEPAGTQAEHKVLLGNGFNWLLNLPGFVRYGAVAMTFVIATVLVVNDSADPGPVSYVADNQQLSGSGLMPVSLPVEAGEQYSREEVQQALSELNIAIEYLNQVSRRTEAMVGERFVVTPLQNSLNASFENIRRNDPPIDRGPI